MLNKLKTPAVIYVHDIDTLKDLWNRLNMSRASVERELTKNDQDGNFIEFDYSHSECNVIWEGIDKLLIDLGERSDD